MPITITDVISRDIRFPTSRTMDGSDAVHPDPDYSAAYVVVKTDQAGLEGHGLTFTPGRGNEICVAAIRSLKPLASNDSISGGSRSQQARTTSWGMLASPGPFIPPALLPVRSARTA